MSNFKDWFEEEKKYYPLRLDAISCRKGYEAGAASRQAEIDCLKVELDAANERALMLLDHKNKMVDRLQGEIKELQKRIDEALRHTVDHDGYDDLTHIIKILKGESK